MSRTESESEPDDDFASLRDEAAVGITSKEQGWVSGSTLSPACWMDVTGRLGWSRLGASRKDGFTVLQR